jgi:DNA-directed RNA polymerase subunit RPC12/RpoP
MSVLVVNAQFQREVIAMSRDVGDSYRCVQCGAELVYEKPGLCDESQPHSEICFEEQMQKVGD